MANVDGAEFVGCDLHYHADKPTFDKDPSTLEGHTHRPVSINGKRQLVIDMHSHCQVMAVWPLIKGRPEIGPEDPFNFHSPTDDDSSPFDKGPLSRVETVTDRLAEMDKQGVDMQVLSGAVEQYYYWSDRDLAAEIVSVQNDKLTEVAAAHPDRFVPLAHVALHHPDLAAEQLQHAVKNLGHRGCMITGSVNDLELSDPMFHPFWAKAEELDCVVFIHPRSFTAGGSRLEGKGFLKNIIGNPLETTVALSHLIYEGTLDRFPGLKIAAAHGGGYLPSFIGRSDHGHNSADRGARGDEKKKPSEYLKQLYFDTLVYNTENLSHLINECGIGQLMLGTDHPFGMTNENPVAHILSTPGLSDDDIEALLSGNAKKLFKVDHV
jgi:aminocarboxymuconate-semialdehyde decarboxylase